MSSIFTVITVVAIVAVFLLIAVSAAGFFGSHEQQRVDDASGKPMRGRRRIKGG